MKTTTLSTNKIIILLVFICAAIMTSLFVFKMSHKTQALALNQEDGTLFPVPRDIKSFELSTADNQPFTEKNFRDHWTLLFFGFTNCASICPTSLTMLSSAYEKLSPHYPNLQIVFVSLDPERDSRDVLGKYTNHYQKNFIGVSGKIQELRKLQSQLGIYSERDSASQTYQIQHTSSIILINPNGQWAGLYKYGMTPERFIQSFNNSMSVLAAEKSA